MSEYLKVNKSVVLNNGIEMPILGLGIYAPGEKDEVRQAVRWAIEAGYGLIDIDCLSKNTDCILNNEAQVGRGIQDAGIEREELFITSKVLDSSHSYENVLQNFNQSLNRLQTDYIDLYLVHWPVPQTYKETWLALEKLYSDGLIRAIGVSHYYESDLEKLFECATIIPAVNVFEQNPFIYLPDFLEYCRNKEICPKGYAPLVGGREENNRILEKVAENHDKSTYQILIRWAIQQGIITVPKSVNKKHIEANFKIWDFEITDSEMNQIEKLSLDEDISWVTLFGDPDRAFGLYGKGS